MWKIKMGRDLANLVHVNAEIVPFPENHVDVGTAPIHKSRVNVGTVYVTWICRPKFRFPRRAIALQRCYGCYDPRLTKSRSVAILKKN